MVTAQCFLSGWMEHTGNWCPAVVKGHGRRTLGRERWPHWKMMNSWKHMLFFGSSEFLFLFRLQAGRLVLMFSWVEEGSVRYVRRGDDQGIVTGRSVLLCEVLKALYASR